MALPTVPARSANVVLPEFKELSAAIFQLKGFEELPGGLLRVLTSIEAQMRKFAKLGKLGARQPTTFDDWVIHARKHIDVTGPVLSACTQAMKYLQERLGILAEDPVVACNITLNHALEHCTAKVETLSTCLVTLEDKIAPEYLEYFPERRESLLKKIEKEGGTKNIFRRAVTVTYRQRMDKTGAAGYNVVESVRVLNKWKHAMERHHNYHHVQPQHKPNVHKFKKAVAVPQVLARLQGWAGDSRPPMRRGTKFISEPQGTLQLNNDSQLIHTELNKNSQLIHTENDAGDSKFSGIAGPLENQGQEAEAPTEISPKKLLLQQTVRRAQQLNRRAQIVEEFINQKEKNIETPHLQRRRSLRRSVRGSQILRHVAQHAGEQFHTAVSGEALQTPQSSRRSVRRSVHSSQPHQQAVQNAGEQFNHAEDGEDALQTSYSPWSSGHGSQPQQQAVGQAVHSWHPQQQVHSLQLQQQAQLNDTDANKEPAHIFRGQAIRAPQRRLQPAHTSGSSSASDHENAGGEASLPSRNLIPSGWQLVPGHTHDPHQALCPGEEPIDQKQSNTGTSSSLPNVASHTQALTSKLHASSLVQQPGHSAEAGLAAESMRKPSGTACGANTAHRQWRSARYSCPHGPSLQYSDQLGHMVVPSNRQLHSSRHSTELVEAACRAPRVAEHRLYTKQDNLLHGRSSECRTQHGSRVSSANRPLHSSSACRAQHGSRVSSANRPLHSSQHRSKLGAACRANTAERQSLSTRDSSQHGHSSQYSSHYESTGSLPDPDADLRDLHSSQTRIRISQRHKSKHTPQVISTMSRSPPATPRTHWHNSTTANSSRSNSPQGRYPRQLRPLSARRQEDGASPIDDVTDALQAQYLKSKTWTLPDVLGWRQAVSPSRDYEDDDWDYSDSLDFSDLWDIPPVSYFADTVLV